MAPPVPFWSWEEGTDLRVLLCTVNHSGKLRIKRRISRKDTSIPAGSCGGRGREGHCGACSRAPHCQRGSALDAASSLDNPEPGARAEILCG